MITPDYVSLMASYNRWQNENLYGVAAQLDEESRRLDRGAFFGSIHATLNHVLWGDQRWMSRFAGTPEPRVGSIQESIRECHDWSTLRAERVRFDAVICDWAKRVDANWLGGTLEWHSGSSGQPMSQPRWILVTHMFNHQTHHRGQVHAMLTAAGGRPGDTDIPWMPTGRVDEEAGELG